MGSAAALQLADQVGPCGGGKEDDRGEGDDNAVEVDAGPDGHGVTEAEQDKGEGGEGQCKLGGDPTEDVVVPLVCRRFGAVRSEEKGTDVAAEV